MLTVQDAIGAMFSDLATKAVMTNSLSHNAAVVLATPEFTKSFGDQEFMGSLAKLLAGRADANNFNVLGAIVDHIAPPLGSYRSSPGISVLRGNLDQLMPDLWQPEQPRSKEDADSVAALSFSVGRPTVTLPLARTTFQNSKTSTLFASSFNLSKDVPQQEQRIEKSLQHVLFSDEELPRRLGDLGLWAPLVPITAPRLVTASFGNIVRGVEVDGQSIPASTELEDAVNSIYKHASGKEIPVGSVGVWALVTPKSGSPDTWLNGSPSPLSIGGGSGSFQDLTKSTVSYLQKSYSQGARLFKIRKSNPASPSFMQCADSQVEIVSGGGGWGVKKGLLSLDPQRTHFALSEEEEMQRFMQSMDDSGFAPSGSTIQFLMAVQDPVDMPDYEPPNIVFGVPGSPQETGAVLEKPFIGAHFGALSNQGIFVSDPASADAEPEALPDETRLTVPHSRFFVTESEQGKGFFGSMRPGFADAGLAALLL